MTSAVLAGTSRRAAVSFAAFSASIVPRATPISIASAARTVSWVVKALVDATPISGPARVRSEPSDSRAMALSATFTMEMTVCPCLFA